VGLFDDTYFLIFEDSDWSARAASAGVALVVDTRTVIEHRVSATFAGAASYLGLYYYARNGLRFGRTRCQPSGLRSARFLRRHVLPHVVGPARRQDWQEAWRRALVVATALADASRNKSGEAPALLQRRARAWAAQ
jgi:GT2 family glycosyltransferase